MTGQARKEGSHLSKTEVTGEGHRSKVGSGVRAELGSLLEVKEACCPSSLEIFLSGWKSKVQDFSSAQSRCSLWEEIRDPSG